MTDNSNEFLDLSQLARVLDEIQKPPTNPLSDWGALSDVLTEIKHDTSFSDKLKEILKWINDNPTHSYPKRVQGWINAIRSQFCPERGEISAQAIVDRMVQLEILNVIKYNKRIRRIVVSTNRVRLNHKRCHSDIIDDDVSTKRRRDVDDDLDDDFSAKRSRVETIVFN